MTIFNEKYDFSPLVFSKNYHTFPVVYIMLKTDC
nr:MAG TPA: Microtubule-associated protein tau, F-actin, protein binding, Alzheimer's [Microviridae sp.]